MVDVAPPDMMASAAPNRHRLWVRLTHWLIAAGVVVLLYSGLVILMAHPRLYWGDTGNDLMQPWIELPLGKNYRHGGWEHITPFFGAAAGPVTAERHFEIFNQNGWARSLHFLAAWGFLAGLGVYLAMGILSGHLARMIIPRRAELTPSHIGHDIAAHLQFPMPRQAGDVPYGILQKLAYAFVILVALPLMVLTGMTMSPAIVAAWPVLLDLFGGTQSARSIHFIVFSTLVGFVLIHLAMVLLTGPVRHLRAMILGK